MRGVIFFYNTISHKFRSAVKQKASSSGNTFLTEGCRPATPEQRKGGLDFPCAGAFRSFGRQKNMKERLEENTSEQLRLNIAVNTMTSESENSPRVCR